MKNKVKLQWMGIGEKEPIYYYLKFGEGTQDVTDGFLGTACVCVIPYQSCDGTGYVRGVAFCNPRDQFNKRLGRSIALGRALKALEQGEDTSPVPKRLPVSILIPWGISFLSSFNPVLTVFERKLLRVVPNG